VTDTLWRWIRRPVVAGAVAVFAIRFGLALAMATPIIHPDEAAYLGNAHYLAFGTGLVSTGAAYGPGWGLVLAPFSRVLDDPLDLYHAALLINALLGVGAYCCGLALARRLAPAAPTRRHVLAAVAVAALPALLLSTLLVNVSSLFIAATLLIAVLAVRAWEDDRPRRWIALGLAWGALVSVHPTAVAVGVGVVAATTFGLRPSAVRHWFERVAPLAIGAAPVALASILLAHRISDATPAGPSGATTTRLANSTDLVSSAVGGHHLVGLFGELAGQVLYLTASTGSLFLVGLFIGVPAIRAALSRAAAGSEGATMAVRLRAFAAVTAVSTLAASVLVINPPDDSPLERLLYGRYNEHVIALVVLVGVSALLEEARLWNRSRALLSTAAVAIAAVTLLATRIGKPGNAIVERQDVLGLSALLYVLHRLDLASLGPVVAVLVLISLTAVWAVSLLDRTKAVRPVLLAAGSASILLIIGGGALLIRGSRTRADERRLVAPIVEHVRSSGDGCIGYDPAIGADWHLLTYEFMLPDVRFRPVTVDADGAVPPGQPCTSAVLAPPDDRALPPLGLVPTAVEHTPAQRGVVLYVLETSTD
jgi:hypothetical protein